MNLPYLRVYGGTNRSNRSLVESLAASGHDLCVVVPALATPTSTTYADFLADLRGRSIQYVSEAEHDTFRVNKVEVIAVREPSRLRAALGDTIRSYKPDWILVSSEDQSQNLLGAAMSIRPRAVVYLAHTPQMFPFGPASLYPGEARTRLVQQTAGVVAISTFVANYINQWAGCKVFVNHPPHYGVPPFVNYGTVESGFVTLLNACSVKGISILTSLARVMPDIKFAAVPGWGTTDADLTEIAKYSNITILKNSKNLDDILRQTHLLLMPSLWIEGFGMSVIDAMLRGIPVLASNLGGLPEAKLGTEFVFDVAPITRFARTLDSALLPAPIIPPQSIDPWSEAISGLMSDRDLYKAHSLIAREVSNKFVANLSCAPLEKYLMELGDQRYAEKGKAIAPKVESSHEDLTSQLIPGQIQQLTPEQRALFVLRRAERRRAQPREGEEISVIQGLRRQLPLSFAQQRLWFLSQMAGGSEAYHIAVGVRLKGKLNRSALRQALDRILARHEILRTTFVLVDGEPMQRISSAEDSRCSLTEHDLRKHEDAQVELEYLCRTEPSAAFDFESGPLIRGRLIQLGEEENVLLLTMHHIVSDGWSMGVLVNELNLLYSAFLRGQADPLPELKLQYGDYAVWQRRWLEGNILRGQATYWKTTLAGLPLLIALPTDHTRPTHQDYSGSYTEVMLDEELTAGLKRLAGEHATTLFMTLLALWAILLSRLSAEQDVVIGTPTANRGRTELEKLIGFFVNTLALRLDLSGSPTVGELLNRVKTQVLGAQQHQDLPFEQVVEITHPSRRLAHSPLFQIMFIWQNEEHVTLQLPELEAEGLQSPYQVAKFDLTLALRDAGSTIVGRLEYATALFEPSTIGRYKGYLQNLLHAMVADDSQTVDSLSLLGDSEFSQVVYDWNNTKTGVSGGICVHEWFAAQVAKTPDSTAVVFKDQYLSYRELNRRANQVAHYLLGKGVGPESIVGLALPRSLEMIIGLLGTLKAGAAYLPLDPGYPRDRLLYMMSDSRLRILITESQVEQQLPSPNFEVVRLDQAWQLIGEEPSTNPRSGILPENLVYVIYTSGSTGSPKGAMITHYGLVNYLQWATENYIAEGAHGAPLHSSLSFDLTVTSLFCPILSGQHIQIISEAGGLGELGQALLTSPDFSFCKVTPAHLDMQDRMLSVAKNDWASRLIIVGGEALKYEAIDRAVGTLSGGRIINEYGPTETVVGCSAYELCEGVGDVPIGRGIANTELYVLNGELEPVPVRAKGELYIGGAGLGRGYLGRPELTAARFVPNLFGAPGSRMYRTGDMGCWRKDGVVEFLGRYDFQVKIRGFRIEPGEIESVLLSHKSVTQAVIVAREDPAGQKQLVGYVVPRDGEQIAALTLRHYVAEKLPDYMVPTAIIVLAELPLSPNGKLDRKALPTPEFNSVTKSLREPRTREEEILAGLFAEILHLERVGIDDNFFDLGGHSLLATRLINRIRSALGIEVSVGILFASPTVADLAPQLLRAQPSRVPLQVSV